MGKILKEELLIPQLNCTRTIRIYLPNAYEQDASLRFPVLYMHDGQNIFSQNAEDKNASWCVDDTMNTFEVQGKTKGIIVVGVDNGENRLDEYSPWKNTEIGCHYQTNQILGGLGSQYADFLANDLKSYIDTHYRTLPQKETTAVAGCSMGGLISLYLAFEYPETYSKIGAFSTASWFAETELLDFMRQKKAPKQQKYFISVGTNETSDESIAEFPVIYQRCSENIRNLLLDLGVSEKDILFLVNPNETHHEQWWAKHFPQFVEWAYRL